MRNSWLAAVLLVALPCLAAGQTAILQIRVVEGDGAVHGAGSRASKPLVVEVTDETGRPIQHAAVSFHLPDDGPSGSFPNNLHTDVAMTDAQGRAAVHGLQWNRIPGRFQIRIVASFEQARAGVISSQYIEGPTPAPNLTAAPQGSGRFHSKWIWVGAIVVGGAAAGLLAGHAGGGSNSSAAPPASTVTIGAPSIAVSKP